MCSKPSNNQIWGSMGESCFSIQVVDSLINDKVKHPNDPFQACLVNNVMEEDAEIT